MSVIQQDIHLAFRYPVHFTTGVFDVANPVLRDSIAGAARRAPAKALLVVDRGVHQQHPGLVDAWEHYCAHHQRAIAIAGPTLVVPGGEPIKTDTRALDDILHAINDAGLCRHSYLIAVGGGAMLDVAGYAAAIAHRGIRLIRMPTTVLAQDDSGVGVKNGVNAFGKKNYLGTFAPPFAVINDLRFLTTLDDRDWRSGIAEAVKVGLIKDASFFDFLEQHAAALVARDMSVMEPTIQRCAELHLSHIATGGDPFEMGSSRPLDFGHWAAHKLESLTDYRLRHGEAVAIGMALDSTYAYLSGLLDRADWRRIIDLLTALGFALHVPELSQHAEDRAHPRSVMRGLEEFREHLGGEPTVTLLRSIGAAVDVHDVDAARFVESIGILKRLEDARPRPRGDEAYGQSESRRTVMHVQRTSPLNGRELVDEYFVENRTRLLEIAAFLDRLDRASAAGPAADDAQADFRLSAFKEALDILARAPRNRLGQIQLLLSDPTTEPLDRLDRKSALGAYDRWSEEVPS